MNELEHQLLSALETLSVEQEKQFRELESRLKDSLLSDQKDLAEALEQFRGLMQNASATSKQLNQAYSQKVIALEQKIEATEKANEAREQRLTEQVQTLTGQVQSLAQQLTEAMKYCQTFADELEQAQNKLMEYSAA